jgi:alpha-D-ribose 1-methylphosphonate 5-triphosphate synthase subunit PhnG
MAALATDIGARQHWMSVLAKARSDEVEAAWEALDDRPGYRVLRGPEVGLVMVQGRAGGTGLRFNLGEMSVTRCTVELDGGPTGHSYVCGRDTRHAELAAVFDAMLQVQARRDGVERYVITRLAHAQAERQRRARARAAATRVEFLTLVRGEE